MVVCMQCVSLLHVIVDNKIGDGGAKALAASLQKNTSLTTLNLRSKRRGSVVCSRVASVEDVFHVCVRVHCHAWINSDYALPFAYYFGDVSVYMLRVYASQGVVMCACNACRCCMWL